MYNLTKRIKNTATVTLSTTAAEVLPIDNNRGHVIVQNLDSSIVIWVGTSAVSTSNGGVRLAAGETWSYYGRDKLWAVAASGTPELGLTIETMTSNTIRRLQFAAATVSDSGTQVSVKLNRKHRTTVQNLSSATVYAGNQAGAGVKLAQYARVDFHGTDAVWVRGAGTNEVQVVTVSEATGGTFTLTYNGQTTDALAYNATAATVQTKLRALSTIGTGNVNVTGSAGGPYTVTFVGALANSNVSELVVDGDSLTGGETDSPAVEVTTNPEGASATYTVGVTTQLYA